MAAPLYTHLFPGSSLARTAQYREQTVSGAARRPSGKPAPAREFDQSDIFTYLLARGAEPEANPEECILGSISQDRTKDKLLSLKILDMTPGFGNVSTRLVETIAYLSSCSPIKRSAASSPNGKTKDSSISLYSARCCMAWKSTLFPSMSAKLDALPLQCTGRQLQVGEPSSGHVSGGFVRLTRKMRAGRGFFRKTPAT